MAPITTLLLLAPALALLGLIFLWPWLHYGWLSVHASSLLTGLRALPNGGANWPRLAQDPRFWQDAFQTLRFAGVSVALELALGLAMALLLHQPSRWRGLSRALVLLPWALPGPVMALGWRWILNDPHGPINRLIQSLGGQPQPFLAAPAITWLATVLADVWKTTPFVAILLLAGLQAIPRDLEEALRLEGAGPWTLLWRLRWPLLAPFVGLAVLFRLAQAMGVFDLVQLLTGGGPAGSTETLALYAYLQAMRFLDFGYSATVMLASFAMILLLSVLWLGRGRWRGVQR
ncbi:MAG: sugar ABC transporter permease [Cyanobacteria bacterium K_Offshore_surface_m2_239]|nr:sugar ABC transporter permease [Cyanobacteria bacterium K_Offshore_surface_m2_239]